MEFHTTRTGFMRQGRLEKGVSTLQGILQGMGIDGQVNSAEADFLAMWVQEQMLYADMHPFNELMPPILAALEDGVIDQEELQDLLWLCGKFTSGEGGYFDEITIALQGFHGLLAGVIADGVVTPEELRGLSEWMSANEGLTGCWPFDEVRSVVTSVLADGEVTPDAHKNLVSFFAEFVSLADDKTVTAPLHLVREEGVRVLKGVCAVCPEIDFSGRKFCFTGKFSGHTKAELAGFVHGLGGTVSETVTKTIDYLVIGAGGNPNWAYACYGRKVEKVVNFRRDGARILVVHEYDFMDAVR